MENQLAVSHQLEAHMKNKGDVTFLVGAPGQEEEVKGCASILSALSPVFESMFAERWKRQEEAIKLPDIQAKVFRVFLKVLENSHLI